MNVVMRYYNLNRELRKIENHHFNDVTNPTKGTACYYFNKKRDCYNDFMNMRYQLINNIDRDIPITHIITALFESI